MHAVLPSSLPLPSSFSRVEERVRLCLEQRTTRLFCATLAGAAVGAALGFFAGTVGAVVASALCAVAAAAVAYAILDRTPQPIQRTTIALNLPQVDPSPQPVQQAAVPLNPPQVDPFLQTLETRYAGQAKMLQEIDAVKRFVQREPIQLQQCYEYHAFHRALTLITEEVKTRADLKGPWELFLKAIRGRPIRLPDWNEIPLGVELELERLQGHPIEIELEKIDLEELEPEVEGGRRVRKMFPAIGEINTLAEEGLGAPQRGYWGRTILFHGSEPTLVVAKRKGSGGILGFLWAFKQGQEQHIGGLTRKAEAASLGIGEQLLNQFLTQPTVQGQPVSLSVRVSNQPAIALYEKLGFERKATVSRAYVDPREGAHEMQLNWAKRATSGAVACPSS